MLYYITTQEEIRKNYLYKSFLQQLKAGLPQYIGLEIPAALKDEATVRDLTANLVKIVNNTSPRLRDPFLL